jgi:hypothetical protein
MLFLHDALRNSLLCFITTDSLVARPVALGTERLLFSLHLASAIGHFSESWHCAIILVIKLTTHRRL